MSLDLASLEDAEDEAQWISETLGDASLASVDTQLSRLIGQLELACGETAGTVDRTIDDIQRSVPRLTFDLQLMREHALLLRFTLDSLTGAKNTTPADVAAVLDHLAVLDTVKGRMEAARDVLREAESWSTLDGEVSSLVAEHAYDKAADRLAEASRSMVVFQNTPEYEGRRALLLSLQNGLEASLSSLLVAAIAQRDLKACRSYYAVFSHIQREAEFRHYWFGSRRAPLIAAWSEAGAEPLVECLPRLFNELDSVVGEERAPIAAVFPDPLAILGAFVQTTLDSLSPTLSARVNDVGPDLPSLIVLYHAAETLGVSLDRTLDRLASSITETNGAPLPSPPVSKKERRTSRRMSMSRRSSGRTPSMAATNFDFSSEPPLTGEPRAWEIALFEPFLDWQAEYADLEARQLVREAPVIPSVIGVEEGAAKRVQEDCLAALASIEAALGRCAAFTHGYGMAGLVQAADSFFAKVVFQRKDALPRVVPIVAGGDEVADYSSADWARFQLALRLLAACRTIGDRLEALEGKIHARIAVLNATLGHPIPGTTNGALTLLRQCSLHSTELAALLSAAPSSTLLPSARAACIELTRSCQRLLHDTVLGPLLSSLSSYSSLSAWTAAVDTTSSNAFDLKVPTFSLSPTETASRLGEGLFNLPRLFEVYADDDALAYSLSSLPFPPPSPTSATEEMAPVEAWLRSLTLGVLDHLVDRVLTGIRALSEKGAAQLACDLAYVGRVAKVLEAESERLERWRECCEVSTREEMGDDEVGTRVARLRAL